MNIKELEDRIKTLNELYRVGNPGVCDSEYDSLVEELKSKDPNNEWLKKIEPAPVLSSGRKLKLPLPMKSLNKVKMLSDLKKWADGLGLGENTEIVLMPKFDGLSLLRDEIKDIVYSRGGIENEGQNCTKHYHESSILTKGTKLHFTFGEYIINNKTWENKFQGEVSEESGLKFKSPRNTAAGILNRDELSVYTKYCSMYRYGADPESMSRFNTYFDFLEYLSLTYSQYPCFVKSHIKDLSEGYLANLYSAWRELFPADGIVIYINDMNMWKTIGRNQTTGNPLYAIAYKHPDFTDTFSTTVTDITWGMSKSGALKPVVNIEPVDTGDCSMENPTGYNAAWVSDREIAKGAKVIVTRSGCVIPKILRVTHPASEYEQDKLWDGLVECPFCGATTKWNESMKELMCVNPECSSKILSNIIFFYLTCGIENVGEETFTKIFNAGIKTLKDFLHITFDEIKIIPSLGCSAAKTLTEFNEKILKDGVDVCKLFHASNCFSGLGEIKIKKCLDEIKAFESLDEFLNWLNSNKTYVNKGEAKTKDQFMKGISLFLEEYDNLSVPIVMEFDKYYLKKESEIPSRVWETIPGMCELKIIPIQKNSSTVGDKLLGMKVCFSGIRDKDLEEKIKSNGGEIVSGVSKNTTHLIVKDPSDTTSKISKASSLGVKILSIEDFKSIYF